ncbi:aspartate carbamoyltransferase [Candidatus Gracilibacteria bacterium]|nr:aspartate carbamoyltransferase [Candidatus Gracilibacteria bacterium]
MKFKGQHILSTQQFDKEGLLSLFAEAKKMEKLVKSGKFGKEMDGKIMATLFYEPSTRTRFSFEAAMLRLGGRVVSNADMMQTSSVRKLETLEDTGKVVSQIANVIAMRHPEKGSVGFLAEHSDVPVINAGDGGAEHPTQALLDLYTIWKEKGKIDGLTIGMVGDLKYGRVPHSQAALLKYFKVKLILVSPPNLKMPPGVLEDLKGSDCCFEETGNFGDKIGEMDVIGMTRIQKERFENLKEYERAAGFFVLDKVLMNKAKKNAIIIHPLPRVDEIAVEVDTDPRARYFHQVGNGVAIRMALLKKVIKG